MRKVSSAEYLMKTLKSAYSRDIKLICRSPTRILHFRPPTTRDPTPIDHHLIICNMPTAKIDVRSLMEYLCERSS